MMINSIRGKTLDLLAFLDVHNPHIVAIQETKTDSSIATIIPGNMSIQHIYEGQKLSWWRSDALHT